MVRTLILALCATVIISCNKQEDNIITLDAIEIASVQEPQTLGILEQLSKDVKARRSGRSVAIPYITSCIDDRTDLVISGPITNPSSFVDGSDRLDLDLFTFEGSRYIVIRSEDDLAYGLPDDYLRMWYINEGSSLGVYTASGKQASIDGDWNFLFEAVIHSIYEIDDEFNVVRSDLPLATVSINCAGVEGWYATAASEIDWRQGTSGEYNTSQNIDSVYIRLNSAGEYVSGGYLRQDSFYLENVWRGSSIGLRYLNSYSSSTTLEPSMYANYNGFYDNNGDGNITHNYQLDSEVEYDVRGYTVRANGSSVNFIWYPYGVSSTRNIGMMNLTKVPVAPRQQNYDAAVAAFNESHTGDFFEAWGNNFSGSLQFNGIFHYDYFSMSENGSTGYHLNDECYTTTSASFVRLNPSSNFRWSGAVFGTVEEGSVTNFSVDGNINDYYLYSWTNLYDEAGEYTNQIYTKLTSVDSFDVTICEPADTVN